MMAKKGRPVSDIPRNKQIRIRLTEKEFDDIHTIAEKFGMNVSDYVRMMCISIPKIQRSIHNNERIL